MKNMLRLIIIVISAILVGGCTAGNYGKVTRSLDVDEIFRSGTLPADYRYYYTGEKNHPPALLGIHNDYSLQSRSWTAVDPDSDQLAQWRSYFSRSKDRIDYVARQRLSFAGYSLRDGNDREFGMVYSLYPWIVATFPEENVVNVYPPEPYRKGRTN